MIVSTVGERRLVIFVFILLILGFTSLYIAKRSMHNKTKLVSIEQKKHQEAIISNIPTSPAPSCTPRPPCLDQNPSCNIPTQPDFCPLTPEQIAQNFYNTFTYCMQNPPLAASGKVQQYCQIHNQYSGSQLENKLDELANKDIVPVICAQNPPESVTVDNIKSKGQDDATVALHEQFASNSVIVNYILQKEQGDWKVENIICPQP